MRARRHCTGETRVTAEGLTEMEMGPPVNDAVEPTEPTETEQRLQANPELVAEIQGALDHPERLTRRGGRPRRKGES